MILRPDPCTMPPLRQWNEDLDRNMDWIKFFSNLFYALTDNHKLIQFYYKLWHRISTSRHIMRHKMKIDLESPVCSLCNEELETLQHIFLNCKCTRVFLENVNQFITSRIDGNYRDPDQYFLLPQANADPSVDLVNAVTNLFLARSSEQRSAAARSIY